MPKDYPKTSRYFYFRKTKGGFFFSNAEERMLWETWSISQANQAQEIAPLLNDIYSKWHEIAYKKRIEEIEKSFSSQTKKSKLLKISLQVFKKHVSVVDSFGAEFKIACFIEMLQGLIDKDYTIAFNFSEVFLRSDEPLPSHASDANDFITDDKKIYQDIITSFSYQFSKAIFNRFSPEIYAGSSETEKLVASQYASIKQQDVKDVVTDLETPLATLPYFNSSYEACIHQTIAKIDFYPKQNWIMLSFKTTPDSEWSDLLHCIEHCRNYKEIIIILQGECYELPEVRKKIHDEIQSLIIRVKCTSFLHLILLTKNSELLHPEVNLKSLAPLYQKNENSFSPLAHQTGYYLSDPHVFRLIGIYQREDVCRKHGRFSSDKWLEHVENSLQASVIKPEEKVIEEEIKGYIFGQEPVETIRSSKRYNKQELKSQIGLTFTYNLDFKQEMQQSQSLKQNQELAKQQSIATQIQNTLNQHVSYPWYTPPMSMVFFLDELRISSVKGLKKKSTKETQLLEKIYYTSWYQENYSREAVLKKIYPSHPTEFLIDVFAKTLGLAYAVSPEKDEFLNIMPEAGSESLEDAFKITGFLCKSIPSPFDLFYGKYAMVPLPGYSCESIELYLPSDISSRLMDFSDGINPASRHTGHSSLLGNTVMQGWDDVSATLSPEDFDTRELPINVSSLALLVNSKSRGYQSHLNASLSVFENTTGKESSLLASLLELFEPSSYKHPDEEIEVESREIEFLWLIKLAFPDSYDVVSKFVKKFEVHNLDNVRILVQLLISVGQKNFKRFLNYLAYLDERCLLSHFYKIYFKYAPTVFSLVNFFERNIYKTVRHRHHGNGLKTDYNDDENKQACFLALAQQTPLVSSKEDWPLFEKFAHAVLVFAAKNHMLLTSESLKEIENFYHRVTAKFLIYSERNVKQQQQLLKHFVENLVTEEGLSLAPLRKLDTLLVCLENLLDHAIEKHTLWEQISELSALSLAWTDVPYATSYNGFKLICKEMEIKAGSIGLGKNSYSVSLNELKKVMQEFNAASPTLTTTVFRYLGKESFREDLEFYRSLYPAQSKNVESDIINQLIWAYYVSSFTGLQYNSHPDEVVFINQCSQFFQQHPYAKSINVDKVLHISRFLKNLYQRETNAQKGILTLWTLWQENNLTFQLPSTMPMPEVLEARFDRKQFKRFLLTHQKNFKLALPVLLNHLMSTIPTKQVKHINKLIAEITLVEPLIDNLFDHNDEKGRDACLQLLNILIPNFGITYFLDHLLEILVLVENIHHLKNADTGLLSELMAIVRNKPDINLAIALIKLCSEKLQNQPENCKPCTIFLHHLATFPVTSLDNELELVLDHCIEASSDESSLWAAFELYRILKEDAEILKMFLDLLHDEKVHAFLNRLLQNKLPASLIKTAAKLIKKTNNPISALTFIEHAREEIALLDDSLIEQLLKLEAGKLSSLLFLFNMTSNQESLLSSLDVLIKVPEESLHTLVCLCKHHRISTLQLLNVLKSPSLEKAIDELEEQLYQDDVAVYGYNPIDITEKIAQIKYNSWDSQPSRSLTTDSQKALERDYKKLMDSIQNRPVYIERKDGVEQPFTVHQLKTRHFPILFKKLQERIKRGENKKENQLVLLAICSVALKRTCKKFPRSTQLLPLIHSLDEEGNLIQELKTGAGKSIIAAMHAVLRIAEGRTILIPTENEQLGRDGIAGFQDFYHYLGIRCGDRIIEAHSPYSDFVPNGINYSTPYGLSLFFISMAIKKNRLPKNCDVVWDEIDASLTSVVPFRLAATLNPLLLDTKSWSKIYGYMLGFVEEKELFLENRCSDKDDIHNFRQYCLLNHPEKQLTTFLKQIPDSTLGTFIDSARLAVQLEEKVDYMVVEKNDEKKSLYGAPILPHTNRPEPRATFGSGTQPLLHTENNKKLSDEETLTFKISPDTETIISMTPKNLADGIRRKGGKIIGETATARMPNQLQEFRQQYGISAIQYPHFHEDRCEDLGIFAAEGWEDQKNITLSVIQESRQQRSNQPILIICETAQAASDLNNNLSASHHPWQTQHYYGYSMSRNQEEKFIAAAGNENMVSISTKCESRGADFDSEHEHGILVINLCTQLTEEELIQIKGRAARNGKPGQFCSVVDALQLGLKKTAPAEELANAFKALQQAISLKAQQERAKTRFLEDARNLVMWRFLDLRKKADKVLSRQYGQDHSLVDTLEFMKILRDFNKNAETYYSALLTQNEKTEDEKKQDFLAYLTREYNQILDNWLPDEKFSGFKPIEPLIPLEKLQTFEGIDTVKIKQLFIISELFSMGWEAFGHQTIHASLPHAKQIAETLDNYHLDERGLKTIAGIMLTDFKVINLPELIKIIEGVELNILKLLEELPEPADIVICREKALNFVKKYFSEIKTLCREERWEELTLPILPEDIFYGDDNKDSSFLDEIAKHGITNIGLWGAKHIAKAGGKIGGYLFIKMWLIPKMMDALKTQGEGFGDDAIPINLIKAMENLETPLIDFMMAIPSSIQSAAGIWSLLLDKLLPILQHPGANEAAALFNKEMPKLLESLVTFIKALEPLRGKSLKELLNPQTLFPLFRLACQLELIQQMLDIPVFKEILNRYSILDEDFFSSFYHFNFKSLLDFAYILAHPVFFNFLQQLSSESTFSDLKTWLNPETKKVPRNIHPALETLHTYQNNQERLEEASRLKIQGLKKKSTLSPESLGQDLKGLEPVFPEAPAVPESLASQLLAFLLDEWLKSLILLLIITLFCWIIIPIVLVCAIVYAGMLACEKIIDLIENKQPTEETSFEPVIQSLSVSDQSDLSVEEMDLKASESTVPDFAQGKEEESPVHEKQYLNQLINICYPPHSQSSPGFFTHKNLQNNAQLKSVSGEMLNLKSNVENVRPISQR